MVAVVYLLVLVGRHGDEGRLLEHERVERVPSHREDIVSLHHVNPGLVLVHRVQDNLST